MKYNFGQMSQQRDRIYSFQIGSYFAPILGTVGHHFFLSRPRGKHMKYNFTMWRPQFGLPDHQVYWNVRLHRQAPIDQLVVAVLKRQAIEDQLGVAVLKRQASPSQDRQLGASTHDWHRDCFILPRMAATRGIYAYYGTHLQTQNPAFWGGALYKPAQDW